MLSGLLIIGYVCCVRGEMIMDLPSDDAEFQLNGLHEHWKSKTIHFLISSLIIGILPSISAVYSCVNKSFISIILQIITLIWSIIDLFIGYKDPNGYESSASHGTGLFLMFFTIIVIGIGIWNKLRLIHKILSVCEVLLGCIRLGMGVVSMLEFCYDIHTGQCNAHGIMGMSFIGYGFLLTMVLVIPLRGKYSQEMYDSIVITIWGIVNTFTEHRPWEPWSHGDYQHTSMGIIFWCAGLLGIYLSFGRKRNFVPAMTMIFTGYAMSEHVQETIISTKVHGFFGIVLILGGIVRIIEISFLLDEKDEMDDHKIRSFQYITPFCLVLSGLLFMGANEEQLILVINIGADHASYILCVVSLACIMQLWMLILLDFYLKLKSGKEYFAIAGDGDVDDDIDIDDDIELAEKMTSMLSAEELNDFIRPSAACTKPVEEVEKEETHFQLEIENDGIDNEDKKVKKISRAQISLTDCLACSGCVTSSEEVLIAQHSYNEFIKYYEENKGKKYILSISDQCRASIAISYEVTIETVDLVLARIFGEKFQFTSYVPISIGREIIDNALYEEVENNKKRNVGEFKGPILSGSCPGWLVYANKTHSELGPQLSRVKSPMGDVGGILRGEYGKEMYHLSVMPCFDKKLEASGEEDVDMVITPRELVPLLEEYGIDLGVEMSRGCEEGEGKKVAAEAQQQQQQQRGAAATITQQQQQQQPVSQLPPVDTKRTSLLPLGGGGTPAATTAQGSQGSSAQDPLVVAAW
ncbi:hypothetical protein CANINC_003620 [Pichia inconspicua]|uniref:Cytosolic Fe-S cluster assembly factor NAR1 n=1 Tax=Pichia inconspicua TaxID=52247 RepID=A0A4T0WYA6_9ASCO|nr:hypothetical protein CANINC_003620 [[Candida] inconspicua]